jgi:hypothetical protein
MGVLIFKELTARRFYKSFGVKGLMAGSLGILGLEVNYTCFTCIFTTLAQK